MYTELSIFVFFFLDNHNLCCPISLILCCPISIRRDYGGDSNSKCTYYIIGYSGTSIRRHIRIYKLQLKKTKTNHPRAFHSTFECRVFLFLHWSGLVNITWLSKKKKKLSLGRMNSKKKKKKKNLVLTQLLKNITFLDYIYIKLKN